MARTDVLDITNQGLKKVYKESKTVSFDGSSGNGGMPTAATLSTDLTGINNDLTFTAVATDATGNDITIQYVDPAANSASLGVVVVGSAITVNLATDVAGAITSTAAEVDAAIDGEAAAAALVTPANKAANDGSGVVTAMAATALAGGKTGTVALFTVTGDVRLTDFGPVVKEDLAGATATIAIGITGNTAGLVASTTATDIDLGEVWVDNAPASIESSLVGRILEGGDDIIASIATADITDGSIKFYVEFVPLSDDGDVRAA